MVASDLQDRPVISNTSPLINLAGVGLLSLLPSLYGTIWVPDAVNREYIAGINAGEPRLEDFAWINIVSSVAVLTGLPPGFGTGESEAISLAVARNARAILLDEQLARNVATSLSLPVVGTLGVLVAAKQVGLLAAIKPTVDTMIAQGRHMSERLYRQVLAAADEEV